MLISEPLYQLVDHNPWRWESKLTLLINHVINVWVPLDFKFLE